MNNPFTSSNISYAIDLLNLVSPNIATEYLLTACFSDQMDSELIIFMLYNIINTWISKKRESNINKKYLTSKFNPFYNYESGYVLINS